MSVNNSRRTVAQRHQEKMNDGCFEFGIKILLGRRGDVTGPRDRSFQKCQFSPKGMHGTAMTMIIVALVCLACFTSEDA